MSLCNPMYILHVYAGNKCVVIEFPIIISWSLKRKFTEHFMTNKTVILKFNYKIMFRYIC